MRKYPSFQDSTSQMIVILVEAAYCTNTDGFHTLAHRHFSFHRLVSVEAMNAAEN